jgi:hypothetical protein
MPWLIHHMTINCNVLMHVTFKETHEKILNQNKNNWRIEVDQQVQLSDWNFSHHHIRPFAGCCGGQLVDRHFRPPPPRTSIPLHIYSARVLPHLSNAPVFQNFFGWSVKKRKNWVKTEKKKLRNGRISFPCNSSVIQSTFIPFRGGDEVIPFGFSFFLFDSVQRPAAKARKILPMDVFPFVLSYTTNLFDRPTRMYLNIITLTSKGTIGLSLSFLCQLHHIGRVLIGRITRSIT